jgi:hypothetical protein
VEVLTQSLVLAPVGAAQQPEEALWCVKRRVTVQSQHDANEDEIQSRPLQNLRPQKLRKFDRLAATTPRISPPLMEDRQWETVDISENAFKI